MELRITPGINRLYRLALVEADGGFVTLSEHDRMDDAIFAMKSLERACLDAARALARVKA